MKVAQVFSRIEYILAESNGIVSPGKWNNIFSNSNAPLIPISVSNHIHSVRIVAGHNSLMVLFFLAQLLAAMYSLT